MQVRDGPAADTRIRTGLVVALVVLVLGMAQPAIAMNTRTPAGTTCRTTGRRPPSYLDDAPGEQRAWLVPGSGFGLQSWGWTHGRAVPGRREDALGLAVAGPARTSPDHPDPVHAASTSWSREPARPTSAPRSVGSGSATSWSATTSTKRRPTRRRATWCRSRLARSRGVKRVATFGATDFGPAIEIYRVTSSDVAPSVQVRPLERRSHRGERAPPTSSTPSSRASSLPRSRPSCRGQRLESARGHRRRRLSRPRAQLRPGARRRGTGPRGRRAKHGGRVVPDYPANTASEPVRASYAGARPSRPRPRRPGPTASAAWPPRSAPYSAVDGDTETGWRSAYYQKPVGQWLELRWPTAREHRGECRSSSPVDDARFATVARWRVSLGNALEDRGREPVHREGGASTSAITRARVAADHRRPAPRSNEAQPGLHPRGRLRRDAGAPHDGDPARGHGRRTRTSSSVRNQRRVPASPRCSAPTAR